MRYFWNPVSERIKATDNPHTILGLKMDGYVEIGKEEYEEKEREKDNGAGAQGNHNSQEVL